MTSKRNYDGALVLGVWLDIRTGPAVVNLSNWQKWAGVDVDRPHLRVTQKLVKCDRARMGTWTYPCRNDIQ